MTPAAITHTPAFRARRALNWFPLGLAYAMLYMGRYNLTVAKTSLGDLMTKEDFGVIFGVGTVCYAFAFLFNGPLTDRMGGRRAMLIGVFGSCVMNALMGVYLRHVLSMQDANEAPLRTVYSVLYGANMYFQSFGAVAIVKVNSHWFHVRERGGFSGIFGTMISSGIFLAFTVNFWLLDVAKETWPGDRTSQVIVFFVPAALLAIIWVVELLLLRDRPSQAGHTDFDTGDASSGDDEKPLATREVFRRLLTNPIILTVAGIEFCTGIVRNGVMHWFPIYAKEVWVLPSGHELVNGDWKFLTLALAMAAGIGLNALVSRVAAGNVRRALVTLVSISALSPFFFAGWGGVLFVAGVIGGNAAGWVSDLFFQSRRAPAAFGLYAFLTLCIVGMVFTLAPPTTTVTKARDGSGLQEGDKILEVMGKPVSGWEQIGPIVQCVQPVCVDSTWDAEGCVCTTKAGVAAPATTPPGTLAMKIERGGQTMDVQLPDPAAKQRAGDKRMLGAQPELPMSPWGLGILVFLMSLCVIGTHGLLSGTATMDFGGRKAAATAVGLIDGAVYLGTAVQSFSLGFLTTKSWAYWPWFLLPFAILGTVLLTRIWNAKPKGGGGH